MKLKITAKIVEKILKSSNLCGDSRADMYLPERALSMAIVFIAAAIVCGAFAIFSTVRWAIAAVIMLGFGVSLVLCWKNQVIHVISDEQFTYTTMFGKTHTYSFSDIQGLRKNKDSMTLFVAGDKVHIESMAVLSERLVDLINTALANLE